MKGVWFEQEQLTAEDQEICRSAWAKAIETEAPFELELRINAGDSEAGQWNLVRAVPFQGAGGARAGWVGTFTDLTERREREMALKMTEKLALTGRMTSFIAHEINNPLEAITNIHYLLGLEVRGNDSALAYIAMADNELQRISGITKQTLRWSKESEQSAEEGMAGPLFDEVLRLFAGKIRNREVTVAVDGRNAHYFGVLGQIRQVVVNLLSNALDAVPVGGHVWLAASEREGNTEFVVGDMGNGMSEETRQLIFQPFYSTKGDLGNGLGLYISQEIVERHGGTLIADSRLGEGTQMRMTLPSKPSVEQDPSVVH